MGNSDVFKILSLVGSVMIFMVKMSLLPSEVLDTFTHRTVIQMIFDLPSDYLISILIVLAVMSLFFCCGTYFYRLGEHNNKHDLDRVSNKPKARYVGCLALAIAFNMISAFILGIIIIHILGGNPDVYDYCIVTGILAAPLGIVWTIIFCEGISGFGKWLEQKGREAKEVVDMVKENQVVLDQESLTKLFAALGLDVKTVAKKSEESAEETKEEQA